LLEKDQKNIGEAQNPAVNSARWLFQRATEADSNHAPVWQAWALLEKDQKNIGEAQNPAVNSARWLFQRATEADSNDAPTWQAWALLEIEQDNIKAANELLQNGIKFCGKTQELLHLEQKLINLHSKPEIEQLIEQGDLNSAKNILGRLLIENPKDIKALQWRERILELERKMNWVE